MTDTNINSREKDDDAVAMARAFEEYMLNGRKQSPLEENNSASATAASNSIRSKQDKKKKKKKKKKKSSLSKSVGVPPEKLAMPNKNPSDGITATPDAVRSPNAQKLSAKDKSENKRHYQLLRSFNDKQRTWFDLDDRLLSILQNMANIRGRLPLEWKLLHSSVLAPEREQEQEDPGEDWKYHGFAKKPKELPLCHLRTADVQLALSHDVTQHEKMLAGLRSLMSDLAECHEALGRALDTLWKFHLEHTAQREGGEGADDGMQNNVDAVTEVFHMLSMELYRKQSLVPLILDSTNDEILGIEASHGKGDLGSGNKDFDSDQAGLRTVQMCYKSWPRNSDKSCIDEDRIMCAIKLGETS